MRLQKSHWPIRIYKLHTRKYYTLLNTQTDRKEKVSMALPFIQRLGGGWSMVTHYRIYSTDLVWMYLQNIMYHTSVNNCRYFPRDRPQWIWNSRSHTDMEQSTKLKENFLAHWSTKNMTMIIVIDVQTNTIFLNQQSYYWVHSCNQSESRLANN